VIIVRREDGEEGKGIETRVVSRVMLLDVESGERGLVKARRARGGWGIGKSQQDNEGSECTVPRVYIERWPPLTHLCSLGRVLDVRICLRRGTVTTPRRASPPANAACSVPFPDMHQCTLTQRVHTYMQVIQNNRVPEIQNPRVQDVPHRSNQPLNACETHAYVAEALLPSKSKN